MTFHFIGIGGIGMSALARILLQKGCAVRGSDVAVSAITESLVKEGAKVWTGHAKENITNGCVVYNSAIDIENPEVVQAKLLGLPMRHRSDILDELMQGQKPLLVTGTHGKTSTTALLSSVLNEAKLDPSFVVGGIVQSLCTNGRKGEGPYFVAEADESDGSFLKTKAFGAIVTNCEEEHLNYWKNFANLKNGFQTFFEQVQEIKHLFWCFDDATLRSLKPSGFSYGFQEGADLRLINYRVTEAGSLYDCAFQGVLYKDIAFSLVGRHQALNSAAVFGLSLSLGIDPKVVYAAFASFQGVARRLEYKGSVHKVTCFDDYGHHPTEIRETLKALREKVKERRIVVLFQPHRFSRLHALWDAFITCFSDADLLCITDVYSAQEAPIAEITGERLAATISNAVYVADSLEVANHLKPLDVLLTIGAGNVTHMGPPILEAYGKRHVKLKVGVAFGGVSPEHEVSIWSAKNIISALDSTVYTHEVFHVGKDGVWTEAMIARIRTCDVVIPVFHGLKGEDGMIQGFLETLQIPYVGCKYASASLCMHKAWTKQVAVSHGIAIAPYLQMTKREYEAGGLPQEVRFPVWVKAVHLGSSIGVSRATNHQELQKGIDAAFLLDDELIIEQEIRGEEIEFAVLGSAYCRVAKPCRILADGQFYDYEKKYGDNATKVEVPANISKEKIFDGQELALKAYLALGCKGLCRIDFFLDANGKFWLNEANPFPGFTANSGYPKMWEESGLPLGELVDALIADALFHARVL